MRSVKRVKSIELAEKSSFSEHRQEVEEGREVS
jgi:hypothetical protein